MVTVCLVLNIGKIDATTISTAITAQAAPRAKRAFFVRLFRSNATSCTDEHRMVVEWDKCDSTVRQK
jgi:hypothetical protein